MGLRSLNLKYVYDSDQDDILNEFYVPALSESIRYMRLAGSFSSSALAVAAKGISRLIKNGGTMQLVVGAELRPEDVKAIIQGTETSEVVADIIMRDINSIEDECVTDHVKALGWMVANGRLEIKVAIVIGDDGVPLDIYTMERKGIFHPKLGILQDSSGDIVSFGGSINESMMGWLYNDERFYVFPAWKEGFKHITDSDVKKFDTCWNGLSNRSVVLDIPTAFKERLLKTAPASVEELNLERWYSQTGALGLHHGFNPNNLSPWMCQQRAVDAIKANNFGGILKMATGTGKTACALFILASYFKEVKSQGNRIMILVPSGKDRIGGQWERFLRKNCASRDYVFRFDSETTTEERRDVTRLWKEEVESDRNLFVVITVESLRGFPFNGIRPDFLIGDEVHEYGTVHRMTNIRSMIGEMQYRIGLSATPERFYDTEGTKRILDYFGPIVFRYTIKEAQKEEKYPKAETVLANYSYNLSIVELTGDEERRVKELTAQIGRSVAMSDSLSLSEDENIVSSRVGRLLERRALVIKCAEKKLDALRELLKMQGSSLRQCIVYCENTNQLDRAEEVFKSLGILSYVKYHYQVQTRAESLELFRDNDCNYILSINCLDQGLDIQGCQTLILLSGSTNPRQYIQRRGRVLRNYMNKPPVQIFDMLAFPHEVTEGYRGLVKSQLLRAWEFVSSSQSPEEKAKLITKRMEYGITPDELTKEIESW